MAERKQFKEKTKELTCILKKELDEKRFNHTLSVAQTAACLAMCHGENPYRAYLAGLLHDCAKCIPHDKKTALCRKYNIKMSDAEKNNPELLHAKLGSCLAREKYGIEDEEILSAIRWHTTGKPDMKLLEKIIYIADYIEIYRKPLLDMDEIRREAFSDLNQCILMILDRTLLYLREKDAVLDEITLETHNYYKTINKGEQP